MPLSENQAKLLGAMIAEDRRVSVRELSRQTDLSEHVARKEIAELARCDLAAGTGRGWSPTGRGRALFQKPVYREYARR
jgi:DeoR/GlpR family transcriptional regulator of sugar metabolism